MHARHSLGLVYGSGKCGRLAASSLCRCGSLREVSWNFKNGVVALILKELLGRPAARDQGEASDGFRATVRAMWIEQGLLRGDGSDPDLLLATHTFLINGLLGSIASLADLSEDEFFVRLDSFSQLYSTIVMNVLADVLPASALKALVMD